MGVLKRRRESEPIAFKARVGLKPEISYLRGRSEAAGFDLAKTITAARVAAAVQTDQGRSRAGSFFKRQDQRAHERAISGESPVKVGAGFSAASRRAESEGGVVFEKGRMGLEFVEQDKGSAVPYHGSRTFLNELAAFSESERPDQGSPYHMVSAGFGALGWRLALQRLQGARQPFGFLVGLGLFLAVLLAVGNALGLLISNTDSAAPAGIYRMVSLEVKRGDLVGASLPFDIAQQGLSRGYLQTGPCVGSAEPVGKIAGALPGDIIDIERDWIAVNGRRIAHSALASHDRAGRPLAHVSWGKHRVSPGEVWLLGFNDRRSWDSRYFGPIPLGNVRGRLEPILTW